MLRSITVFTAGALAGGLTGALVAHHWLTPQSPVCPPEAPCNVDADELAMLQWENRMLVAMVQAGLSGDISGHIQTFSAMQAPPQTNPTAAPHPVTSPAAPAQPPTGAAADALVERLTRADLKLQRQALAEGWATDERLVRERQALWDQARRQLSDHDYMNALHRAGRPNRLLVDAVKRDIKGLQHGDVIWALDGRRVLTRAEYRDYLATLPEQTLVTVEIRRNGQSQQLSVSGLASGLSLIADSVPAPD
ncbi:PDZ domain-containing protein [Ferrimonas balearica]|uniref:PDZ domain-containing protein n=1 Tax=Ferrimonas balearica TaxID=44012 RepID=UPI001F26F121|nr:PDZ domain-containing protein [Ferrimonas balearica]MBY6096356.1 PDZ domain-containing protein [Ferrimonas balearica]